MKDPFKAGDAAFTLQMALGPTFEITTWEMENGLFFDSIKIQMFALYLILMLIILVAGFNIVGTLILMVIEKTREIGVRKAIGASNGMILRIFLNTGAMIGAMGTFAGAAIGLFGCAMLKYVVRFEMPPSVYNFDRLPVVVSPITILIISASAMGVCVLAAFFPSGQAAKLDPVEALRHE